MGEASIITVTELNKTKEKLLTAMKSNFKRDGALEPIMILISQNGQLTLISTPYTNANEKMQMINSVKELCEKTNPAGIAIINEAWVKTLHRDESDAFHKELQASGKRIQDLPDRKECAFFIFEHAYGKEAIMLDIDRSTNELVNEIRSNDMTGIFSKMLAPIAKN